jgi:4-amino-4-deoxy-L-arabinose transferase-like glycosyltransferase
MFLLETAAKTSTIQIPFDASPGIWGAWLVVCIGLTLHPLWWHVQLFHLAGDFYYRLLLLLLPVLFLGPLLYQRIRTKALSKYEPYLLAVCVLLPCVAREPRATAAVAAAVCSCHALGSTVFRILRLEAASPWASLTLRISAGMGLLSLLLFALGMAGLYSRGVFALLLVPAVFEWRRLQRIPSSVAAVVARWQAETNNATPLFGCCMFFLMLFAFLSALSSVTPATNGDAIRMHLSLAKSYLQAGGLQAPPFEPYSYFPQGFEILLTMLWGIGGQAAAQMLNPVQFGLCALTLYAIGRESGISKTASLCGVLLGISLPLIHWDGSAVKNDVGCALYLLAALMSLLLARAETASRRWTALAVFLMACAFGVKHIALFGAVPLTLLIALRVWRSEGRRLRLACGLITLFAIAALGWHVRTWISKGDPVFPQSLSALGAPAARGASLARYAARYFTLPWTLHFRGRENFESPSQNPLGFSLVVFTPLLLLLRNRRKHPTVVVLWFFLGTYLLFWSSFIGAVRYAVAPFLLLSLLVGDRLEAASRSSVRSMRVFALIGLLYCGVFAVLVTVILEMYPHQPALLAHRIDNRQFLRAELLPFGAIDFLNGRAGPTDLVLSIGCWAVSYAPFPARVNHVYRNERQYSKADVAELSRRPYRFLILPEAANTPQVEEAASRERQIALQYSDSNFRVYEVR